MLKRRVLNSYTLTFDWPHRARLTEAARFPQFLLLILAAIYIFPGLVGHDPWKRDETYVTSIVAHLERTLWMPWINAAKSYRAMFDDMRIHLPRSFDCVNSVHLGESEAAMLDYEGGIVAVPLNRLPSLRCDLVWVQDNQTDRSDRHDPTWTLLWSGHRPGDTKERHRLFAR